MIRTLLFSTLYPNAVRPNHGVFVETRLRQLLSTGRVQTHVLAPVPWFPFRHELFGEYAAYASVPLREERNGVRIEHPRYLVAPKVGMNFTPHSLARAGLAATRRLLRAGYEFDLIDAHYVYPDGVAAVAIGRALGKPVAVTARGSDINLLARFPGPRDMIIGALRECAAVITVSAALRDAITSLGCPPSKISVLRNGVDLANFYEEERVAARAKVGASRFTLLSVGNLVPGKGHQFVIDALRDLDDAEAFIVGRGSDESRLRTRARRMGVADRVKFAGAVRQDRLRTFYSAADCLVLASASEGWPNVLLEAMACGTPVVASKVGGVPEAVADGAVGVLMDDISMEGVIRGVSRLRELAPPRSRVRMYAEGFSWDQTSHGQLRVFERMLAEDIAEAACA